MLNKQVEEIMSNKIITLHPKETIKKAIEIFNQYSFHHIPITVSGKVVGILSQGDVLFFKGKEQQRDFIKAYNIGSFAINTNALIEEIMTMNPIVMSSSSTVRQAIESFLFHGINALPVVSDGNLKGIITTHDILTQITK